MKKILKIWLLFAALCTCATAVAERPILIHSHNDYCRRAPFWQAYAQQVYSIEADVFLHDGKLLVGHEVEDLSPGMTFEALYVEPLVTLFGRNGGRAWKDSGEHLQLMVELKSATEPTLQAVAALLGRYPEVFDPAVNPEAVRVAVTGRVPAPADFGKYPSYIRFDGVWDADYTPAQLERIALVSADFSDYSQWNGKGSIIPAERAELETVIDRAHAWGKPVRFWGAPEGTTVYYTFYNMGIDYLNTDHPEACAAFFDDFGNKNFQIGECRTAAEGVTGTKRLDKTTRDFRGFQNDKLQLSKGIDVYTPTYRNDGGRGRVRNVIYLIGDGMGLSQIVAAVYANKGLSTLQMKYIGLQQNNALDAFTTDSAAGGSALATGERHDNRHISMSPEGVPDPSLSDFFHDRGLPVGVVTLGNIADATPTAFYGHSVERDNADELTRCLMDGRIDLLCGSGIREFTRRKDGIDLVGELEKQYDFVRSVDGIDAAKGKVICIDEAMDDAAEETNLTLLADATRASIAKLQERGGDGSLCTTKGIGAFWALQADALDKGRMDRMVAHLADTAEFDRPHRVPSLSADHPKYNPTGRYWQGGVWPGANYMVIDGLYRKGYHDLALEVAENHFNAVFEVWKNTGTFWEYYAPEKIEPGFMARKDFVGWAGLPPIAVFIEYILGIKSDYSEGRIVWDINHTEAHGIDRYPYGPEGVVGLKVKGRNSAGDVPAVSVTTNVPFDLTVTWGDGQSRTVRVEKSGSVKLN